MESDAWQWRPYPGMDLGLLVIQRPSGPVEIELSFPLKGEREWWSPSPQRPGARS